MFQAALYSTLLSHVGFCELIEGPHQETAKPGPSASKGQDPGPLLVMEREPQVPVFPDAAQTAFKRLLNRLGERPYKVADSTSDGFGTDSVNKKF